jgi:hypothetical protein
MGLFSSVFTSPCVRVLDTVSAVSSDVFWIWNRFETVKFTSVILAKGRRTSTLTARKNLNVTGQKDNRYSSADVKNRVNVAPAFPTRLFIIFGRIWLNPRTASLFKGEDATKAVRCLPPSVIRDCDFCDTTSPLIRDYYAQFAPGAAAHLHVLHVPCWNPVLRHLISRR